MDGEFNRARWRGGRGLLNQRVCKLTAANGALDESYLFHVLPQVLKEIEDKTPFVTVKHLSAKDLRQAEIPLPPLDEQKRIAAILDQADELRRLRQRAIDRLNDLGQAIFSDMLGDPASHIDRYPTHTLHSVAELINGNYPPAFLGRGFWRCQATISRMVWKGFAPLSLAVSTVVRTSASACAAHMAR